jgi:hypothetical protein
MPLYYPIVANDRSGLRIMGRADLEDLELRSLIATLWEFVLHPIRSSTRRVARRARLM